MIKKIFVISLFLFSNAYAQDSLFHSKSKMEFGLDYFSFVNADIYGFRFEYYLPKNHSVAVMLNLNNESYSKDFDLKSNSLQLNYNIYFSKRNHEGLVLGTNIGYSNKFGYDYSQEDYKKYTLIGSGGIDLGYKKVWKRLSFFPFLSFQKNNIFSLKSFDSDWTLKGLFGYKF